MVSLKRPVICPLRNGSLPNKFALEGAGYRPFSEKLMFSLKRPVIYPFGRAVYPKNWPLRGQIIGLFSEKLTLQEIP